MCPMALISAIMDTTHFEIKHPCDTSINGLYHRGMIDSLINLSQCSEAKCEKVQKAAKGSKGQ